MIPILDFLQYMYVKIKTSYFKGIFSYRIDFKYSVVHADYVNRIYIIPTNILYIKCNAEPSDHNLKLRM